MRSLYFRFLEPPNPDVFDGGWIELPPTLNPFTLGRALWRGAQVSRLDQHCAVIRFDLYSEVWTMKNNTRDRIVILANGVERFELRTTMSVDIGPGNWRGALTDAFAFELTHERPLGAIRIHAEPDPSVRSPNDLTVPRNHTVRARSYLEKHRVKRLALAYMWRQHLGATRDVARDLSTADVGKAFREASKTIITWRDDLAHHVYEERGRQNQIRDFVLLHRILTWDDVREADAWVQDISRRPVTPPSFPGQQESQGSMPRQEPGRDQPTTRRPPRAAGGR